MTKMMPLCTVLTGNVEKNRCAPRLGNMRSTQALLQPIETVVPSGNTCSCSSNFCAEAYECREHEFCENHICVRRDDRQCADITVCDELVPAKYETVAPTPTSDSICADVKTCPHNQFESSPPTSHSNRICLPIRSCSDTEFAFEWPSATSDATCTPLSVCSGYGEFEFEGPLVCLSQCEKAGDVGCTSTKYCGDRNCQGWKTCQQDEYVRAQGAADSDRSCHKLSTCDPETHYEGSPPNPYTGDDQGGHWSSDRNCGLLTRCITVELGGGHYAFTVGSGAEYELRAPTPTSNRGCS
jgi:hypothetical protein